MAQNFLSDIKLGDNIYIRLGDATNGDLHLHHNGTNSYIQNDVGHFYIKNRANDADIVFQSDDGSGGVATYYTIDGGNEANLFSKNVKLSDNVELRIGSSNDLKIYHNATNSYIKNITGDLKLASAITTIRNEADTETLAKFTENGSVELYHNDSKKFETKSTGATITGNVSSTTANFADNVYMLGGQLYLGASNATTDDSFRLYAASGQFVIASRESGTWTTRFDISDSGAATFTGAVNMASGKITSDGSAAAGAYLELKHANNNSTDVCATINLTNNAGGYAAIVGGTTGANNTGYIEFKTDNAGTQGTVLTLNGDNSATFAGNVTIDKADPTLTLESNRTTIASGNTEILGQIDFKTNEGSFLNGPAVSARIRVDETEYAATTMSFWTSTNPDDTLVKQLEINPSGLATFADDIKLADNKKIKGTTYSAGFISFESDGETRISANDDVVIGYGETLNISNTGVSTFTGSVTAGTFQTSGASTGIVINGQEIYANKDYDGNDGAIRLNRFGYQGGQTKFRDVVIYDGKGAIVAKVDGSDKSTTFEGQVTVDSNWVSDEGSLSIVHDQNTLGGIGIVANSVYKGGLIQRDGTAGDFMELTTYTAQPLKLRTSNTDTVTIAANGETTIKRAVDGDFTGLRIMNQKTYGSGTGNNERPRLVLGIAESSAADTAREGFVIESLTPNETDSSHINTIFKTRASGSVTNHILLEGSNKQTTFSGGIVQSMGNPYTKMIDTSDGGDTYGLNNNQSKFSIYNWTDGREELYFGGDGNATFTGNTVTIDPASGDATLLLQSSTQTLRLDQNSLRTTTNSDIAIFTNGNSNQLYLDQSTGGVGLGVNSTLALLHLNGTGDAIRVESTNTGAGGAQIDLLHFTTSPADEDTHGMINMGGYYTGTTSVYGSQILSKWTDVSERHSRLEFKTLDTTLSTALTLAHDNSATFAGSLTVNGTSDNLFYGDVNVRANKKFKSTSSSSGDYVRLYAGSGTGEWDIYGNGNNLRFSENSGVSGAKVVVDTDLQVDGNLTVTGTNKVLNVEDINVEANEITLNYNASSGTNSTADGAGIRIQDAVDNSTDATISWNGTEDHFTFSHPIEIDGPNINGMKFGIKQVTLTENTFTDTLTINMPNYRACYVKIVAIGDWPSHSSIQFLGEYFVHNGGGAFGEPGMVIKEIDNTSTDTIVSQIVDPSGNSGDRDFVIQLKADDTTSTPADATVFVHYEVRGQFNSIT